MRKGQQHVPLDQPFKAVTDKTNPPQGIDHVAINFHWGPRVDFILSGIHVHQPL